MTARKNQITERPTVCLLGALRIDLSGEPVALPRRKTRSLLYFLAAQPGDHGRDELVDLLWPNLDPAKGRRQLSDALSDLRRTLGAESIVSDNETVALVGAACDAIQFAAALEEAGSLRGAEAETKLSAALGLYGGEFLAGIRIERSERFDDWVQEQRLNSSVAALGAFARLGAIGLDKGDAQGAIDAAQRGLEFDNLREDLWRILIEARSSMGDRAGALAEYARCAETLQRELGVMPEAETETLRRRISAEPGTTGAGVAESKAAKARPPLPFSLRLPGTSLALVGRERELGTLLHAWDSARGGAGGLATIEGEPGIGKSRLAAEFAARAAGGGAVVLAARCPGLSDPPPYGPIEEAVRGILPSMPSGAFSKLGGDWLPWVGRLLPELGLGVEAPERLSPEGEKARLAEAAGRIFEIIAGGRPLLLIVEDIHWAHPATIVLMHSVARRGRPMLVLTTMRDTEPQTEGTQTARQVMADLAKEGLVTSIALSALGMNDTEALVRLALDSAGNGAKANPAAVAKLAEGQPLFALEITRAVLESPDDPDLPESLTNAIRLRIERSSGFAQRILELAAVFGRPVTLQLLGRAVGADSSDESLVNAGEELVARRLLQEEDSGDLSVAHGLIHAAVYKSLSVSRRRALHARAASALEAGGDLPAGVRSEALARHYRLAGELSRATDHLIAAAQRANALGEVDTACSRFRSAAELLQRQGHDREAAEALERAGACVWRTCDVATASSAINDALAIWHRVPDNKEALIRLQVELAQLYARFGYLISEPGEVRQRVDTAVELTEGMSGPMRSLALSARAFLECLEADPDGSERDARQALAEAGVETAAVLPANEALAGAHGARGQFKEALSTLMQNVPLARALGDGHEIHAVHGDAFMYQLLIGDPVSAEEQARLSLEAADQAGLQVKVQHGRTYLSWALVRQDRFEEAAEIVEPMLDDPAVHNDRPLIMALLRIFMAEICAHRGEPERASQLVKLAENAKNITVAGFGLHMKELARVREMIAEAETKQKVAASR